jgi:hypothetical protein
MGGLYGFSSNMGEMNAYAQPPLSDSLYSFSRTSAFLPLHLLAPFCLPLSGGTCGGINRGGIKSATINTTKIYRIWWYCIGLIETEYKQKTPQLRGV